MVKVTKTFLQCRSSSNSLLADPHGREKLYHTLYFLVSLIPRPVDEAIGRGGQETPTVLDHGKVHISPRASSLVTTSTLRWTALTNTCPDLIRSAFQSSNSIGQFIIHDYMGIRAVALTTP